MIYLIDPHPMLGKCPAKCKTLCTDFNPCTTLCGIKPLYGIDPVPI